MDKGPQTTLSEELEAAFAWWRDAGVDCAFSDDPVKWLAARPERPEPQARPTDQSVREERSAPVRQERSAPPPPQPVTIDPASLPQDLASFAPWWLSAPELDAGRTSGRVPPRGGKGAELMVIVPEPESEDRDVLLSGPQGKLLGEMMRAMGCDPGQAYFASALPRHLPGADWQAIGQGTIGPVLRHHIALVSPRRLIAFGSNILPLFGNDLPQGPAVLRDFNLEGQCIPVLSARNLSALLDRPSWKGELWRLWLDWTGGAQAR